jgi:hypothetical protein
MMTIPASAALFFFSLLQAERCWEWTVIFEITALPVLFFLYFLSSWISIGMNRIFRAIPQRWCKEYERAGEKGNTSSAFADQNKSRPN